MRAYIQPDILSKLESEQSRGKLTKMLMKLFEHWQLSTAEQLQLLGMRESSRAVLSKYRQGTGMIPPSVDVLDRTGLLLAIHENLARLFPENPNLKYGWVKRKNLLLNNSRPLDIMLEQHIFGLAKIMRFLDQQLVT